jgi:AcrR family transcriptional regulator
MRFFGILPRGGGVERSRAGSPPRKEQPTMTTAASAPVAPARVTPTRQRLIDAAYELFTRHGFIAVGLDRILADAGVSKQTFYNHFESKDEVMLAVLQKRSDRNVRVMRETLHELAGDDARRQLDAIWDVIDSWLNNDDFRGCIFLTAAAEFPASHEPAHQQVATHWRRMCELFREIAQRAGARDPHPLAEGIMVLIDGAFMARHVCGNTRAADIARGLAEPLLEKHFPNSVCSEMSRR